MPSLRDRCAVIDLPPFLFQKGHPIGSRWRMHDLEGDRTVPRGLHRNTRGTSLRERWQRLSVIKSVIWIPESLHRQNVRARWRLGTRWTGLIRLICALLC